MKVTGIDPGLRPIGPDAPRGEFILLDVRTTKEYVGFHVPGALNVPYDEVEMELPMIRLWTLPVVVYSARGRRSRIAAAKLAAAGIRVFDAGTREAAAILCTQQGQA